jgi:amino acid adenylation domain-containing protein
MLPTQERPSMTPSPLVLPDRAAADLVHAVLAAARRDPGAPAVTAPDGSADYGMLVARSRQLAKELQARGVRPGGRVAVVLAPGREAVAVALAAMSLGAAYVPLDPGQPMERLRGIVANCAPQAVVADPGTAGGLPGALVPRDGVGPWPRAGSTFEDELPVRASDVAYVVHTSGSTGTPKAIQVEHGNLLNLLQEVERRSPLPPAYTGSWWASPSFDVSAWEMWSPLTRGGHVVVVPPEQRLEVDLLVQHLHRHAVQSAFIPPALMPEFCALLWEDEQLCAGLGRMLVGVEPLALGLLQNLCRARPGLAVVNGYGPAETTVCCTLHVVSPTGGDPHERAPIGTAVAGNRLLLLDESGQLADNTGELVVVGAGVARGYLWDDGAATGFIPAPDGSAERAYRTGDRVTVRPDGEFVFLGRVDRQLKVNGYRIEPGEVETAVRRSASVREVVVARRELPGAGPAVVAYVVPEAGTPWDEQTLRSRLRRVLPAYAVPQLLLTFEAIPQTRNGKTDHAALAMLPLPDGEQQEGSDLVADMGTEAVVARAWSHEVPQSAPIATGFVELGGTSLGAVRVAAALRRVTGKEVRASDVLRARDIRHLAALIDVAPQERGPAVLGSRTAPLGPTEQGMWFQDKLHAGKGMYVESLCYELPAEIDDERLARAVAAVCEAHPVLSAVVRQEPSGPCLDLAGPRPVLDAYELGEPADLGEALGELARGSVDLAGGPLFRALLCRTDTGRRILLFVWHHLVTDGWSARLLMTGLARCYDTSLPPARARTTICDLIAERAGALGRPGLSDRLRRASQLLDGVTLPAGSGAASGKRTGTVAVVIDRATTTQLSSFAAAAGVTLATVLLAGYEQALCDILGAADFPLGVAVTDRAWLADAEQTMGCLIDTVVLRGARRDLTDDAAVRTLGTALDDLTGPEHRVPLSLLAAEMRRTAKLRFVDFPPCYFSLDEEAELRLDGARCRPVSVPRTGGRLDATLSLLVGPDGVHGQLEYRWRLLTDVTARHLHERLLHHLVVLARADEQAPTGTTR